MVPYGSQNSMSTRVAPLLATHDSEPRDFQTKTRYCLAEWRVDDNGNDESCKLGGKGVIFEEQVFLGADGRNGIVEEGLALWIAGKWRAARKEPMTLEFLHRGSWLLDPQLLHRQEPRNRSINFGNWVSAIHSFFS
jgi:hypothetical protein